jgi:hypothetical protein
MREFWERDQENFTAAYRNYINQLIAESDSEENTA